VAGEVRRVEIDSGYPGYEGLWEQGHGSGAVTSKLLERIDEAERRVPDAVAKLDQSPQIPLTALARLERDADFSAQGLGPVREDLQTLRRIIGEGPGWRGRLKAALVSGPVALAAVAVSLLAVQAGEDP